MYSVFSQDRTRVDRKVFFNIMWLMDLEVLPKHFIGRNLDSILGHSSKVWCRSGAGWVVVGRQLAKDGHQNFRILCHVENICP